MSEDDTFRALSRSGLEEMRRNYREFRFAETLNKGYVNRRRDFFNSHNWGVEEFIDMIGKKRERDNTN